MSNLKIWDKVCKTDPKYTKTLSFGQRKLTTINAQYQVRQATELWGSYGNRWGIDNMEFEKHIISDQDILMTLHCRFKYPISDNEVASFPISASIFMVKNNKIDDEWSKKVETDILTKALSKLGFAADVFMGRYDDNKYVNELKAEFTETDTPKVSNQVAEKESLPMDRFMKALELLKKNPKDQVVLDQLNNYKLSDDQLNKVAEIIK